MISIAHAVIVTSLLVCYAASTQARSPQEGDGNVRSRIAEQGHGMTLDRAVAQVQRETQGQVLSADTENRNGDRLHHIKVLTPQGRVRVLTVGGGR